MTKSHVDPFVPNIPAIPGLVFRHYQGDRDIEGMLEVHAGCRVADRVDAYSVCYRVPNMAADEYAKDVALSLADGSNRNILIAEIEGRMVAHSRLEWWNEWDEERNAQKVAYLSRGWVVPEWREHGIGTCLLHWAEARAREMDRDRDGAPRELAANASDGEKDAIALLLNEGYELRFLSPELACNDFNKLPDLSPPSGFTIRPLERGQERAVARAIIEANANPNLTPPQLASWIEAEEPRFIDFVESCDPFISRVGWHEDEVAGLHLCRRNKMVGEVANVAVRPAYRMRGLARALMFHCLQAMDANGCVAARLYTGIGTDRDAPPSGPYKMYLGFGFQRIAFHNRYRKPMEPNAVRPASDSEV